MFVIAFKNVLLTLVYILPGFLLCKAKKAVSDHLSTLSAVLIYVCSPCMIINAFMNMEYSLGGLLNMLLFLALTFFLQLAFMGILWLFLKNKYADSRFRILTIGSVMGNVGFFGLPIIKALFPASPEVVSYSCIYVFSMNMLVFTIGSFCITGDKKYISIKSLLLNPSSLSVFVGLPIYIFGIKNIILSAGLDMFVNAFRILGDTTTPLCMIILGIRLATVDAKKLFARPFVYLTCLFKLVVFPLFCYFMVYLLPLDLTMKASILILSATPCASVILNLAEMYNKDTELAANSVLLSTLLCFITIPLLALLI